MQRLCSESSGSEKKRSNTSGRSSHSVVASGRCYSAFPWRTGGSSATFQSAFPTARFPIFGRRDLSRESPLYECLATLITRHLAMAAGSPRYALFQEPLGRRGDPYIEEMRAPTFLVSNEVFYYLSEREADPELVDETIRGISPYPLIGLLAAVDGLDERLSTGANVEGSVLRTFIQGMEYLIVGAYDGDGFVMWAQDDLRLKRIGSCADPG